jgi:hypothetical protein
LRRSQRGTSVFLAAALAALVLSALVASSAAASTVPAKFSNSEFKLTGSGLITLKRNGTEAKSCELKLPIESWVEGNAFFGGNGTFGETRFSCTSGSTTLEMAYFGNATFDTVSGAYRFHVSDYSSHSWLSPYGSYFQQGGENDNGTWVNGSGTTPSTITFKEAPIGADTGGKTITFSGTLKATTLSGGLITLSH